jgi:hypothetical protein
MSIARDLCSGDWSVLVFAVAGQAGSVEEICGRMERTRGFWQNEDIFEGVSEGEVLDRVCCCCVKVVGRIGLSELS